MNNSIGFFQESDGSYSNMRLVSFLSVLAGLIQSTIAVLAIVFGKLSVEGALSILSFSGTAIAAGFTGKYLQKGKEIEGDKGAAVK